MKKLVFVAICWLAAFSTAFGQDYTSIRQFAYKGISFSSKVDELKEKGFTCQDNTCVAGDEFFIYDAGFLIPNVKARNGKTVVFHENHPLKITIDQLYPDTGEQCKNIMEDLQVRFNAKYRADIKFYTYNDRWGPKVDYNLLLGSVKLGEDVLRVVFKCEKVENPSKERLTFVHALFHYENLASRLLIDDI